MSQVYVITNLEGYCSQMREEVTKSIAEDYENNLDTYITINQIKTLVYESCLGTDIEDHPFVDMQISENIFESIRIWIYNSGLSKLAAAGHIECGWDNDANEMIFWTSNTYPNKGQSNESTERNTKT